MPTRVAPDEDPGFDREVLRHIEKRTVGDLHVIGTVLEVESGAIEQDRRLGSRCRSPPLQSFRGIPYGQRLVVSRKELNRNVTPASGVCSEDPSNRDNAAKPTSHRWLPKLPLTRESAARASGASGDSG